MKKILQQENAAYFKLPTFEEIPDVGLYLEQTATFINKYLEPLLGSELTPSMISNYVKKKMIARPEKKQYSREQIAYLFFITISKTVLALRFEITCQSPTRDVSDPNRIHVFS